MNKYAHLNILVHDMINLLYYEYWTDKQKYLYVYQNALWWNHSSWDTETRENYEPDDGRSISRNVAHLNILVHDMINLL